jgi:NAD(P)-dependent dehydrogenase (short-subunit alcohol dehydrogenase family)
MNTIQNRSRKLALWTLVGAGAYVALRAAYRELTKYNVKGKVILITGGSRGLGLILARQLAAKGARIAICSRAADHLGQAQIDLERNGAEVLPLVADVSDKAQVTTLINDVIAHYGALDVLINNAGIIQVGPQDAMTLADYEAAMKSNFWSALYTMLEVIPHFKKQKYGRIVNVTSIGGKVAVPHLLPYVASKFALVGLSEGMHAELKKENIIVTTVVPNLMRTGSPRNITVKGDHASEYAWFKLSGSAPMLSLDAEYAAGKIISAMEHGDGEIVLSLTARLAVFLQGLSPGFIPAMMGIANNLLPVNVHGGEVPMKGYESESELSLSGVGALSDEAAFKNNEY